MNQVTSNDVAKAAAVSRVTVSRLLNNHGNVTEAVRRRVLNAAADLGGITTRKAMRCCKSGASPRRYACD